MLKLEFKFVTSCLNRAICHFTNLTIQLVNRTGKGPLLFLNKIRVRDSFLSECGLNESTLAHTYPREVDGK